MSVPEARRKSGVLLAVLVACSLVAVARGATTPVPVKKTAHNEVGPSANDDWFAWSRSREREVSPLDLFAQQTGGRPFKVNPKGTQAYGGGIDAGRLLFQLLRGSLDIRSDLRLYDLAARRQVPLPAGINTTGWECCGTISGDWILFSRGRSYSRDRQLILLRNLVTGEQRTLDVLRNKNGVMTAGQINGTFAVWARCRPYPRCEIVRYDLAAGVATPLSTLPGKVDYSPSVNPAGTAYFLRSNKGCGKSVELMKQTLTAPAVALATLPPGRDGDVTYANTITPQPPGEIVTTQVYYDRTVCRKQTWDIYRVDDAERAPPP